MALAPLVSLVVGGAATLVLLIGEALDLSPLLRAALAVAAMAAITQALHLDGLADLADGLGSARPAAEALDIMKRSDIGPFGVVTLLLTLLIQVAALAGGPPTAPLIAAATGRLVLAWACRPSVPAARPGGLGAMVAGTVRPRTALMATVAVLATALVLGALTGDVLPAALAVVFGLVAALALLHHAVRRLNGITGDVLGALIETAATVALITLA